ncbi:MAG: hypothetical protein EKK40_02190 [Bradyrhizobiaceae bacterium]|nr:MAG: hypothetical protein EKK40_02190 [Bradyrhizobiaceae bacterium]
MPNDRDRINAAPEGDGSSGWMASLLAEEDAFDRRALWRLGTWAASAVGALTVAVLSSQQSVNLRSERMAYADMTRQAQQIQWIAKDSQNESRRLAAAVDTLNGDRDRLYSRVTVLEQNLESVTGSISKPSAMSDSASLPDRKNDNRQNPAAEQKAAGKSDSRADATTIPLTPVPVNTLPVKPQPKADSSAESNPEIAPVTEGKKDLPLVTASTTAMPEIAAAASQPVQRTDFGVDIGTANSVEGLRAMWRSAVTAQGQALAGLQPIIVVKERNDGAGLQLRLVAGPLANAAEAAKICAQMIAARRGCQTAVYDGQRLAMDISAKPAAVSAPKPPRRTNARQEETPPPAQRGLTSIFGR